jgi:hypothetical protein
MELPPLPRLVSNLSFALVDRGSGCGRWLSNDLEEGWNAAVEEAILKKAQN